jgi:hypothetical protein
VLHLEDMADWDAIAEQELSGESGRVQLWITDAGPAGEVVERAGPGQCRLRVACRGRDVSESSYGRTG